MPWISITLADGFGRTTKRLVEIETQVDLAGYLAQATALATLLEPITDLELIKTQLIIPTDDVFAVTGKPNLDVGATFVGWTDHDPKHKAVVKVPGIKAALVTVDDRVDLADEDVAAFLAAFTSAGGDFLVSDGEHMVTWIRGVLDH